jgi:hypothetical protein
MDIPGFASGRMDATAWDVGRLGLLVLEGKPVLYSSWVNIFGWDQLLSIGGTKILLNQICDIYLRRLRRFLRPRNLALRSYSFLFS